MEDPPGLEPGLAVRSNRTLPAGMITRCYRRKNAPLWGRKWEWLVATQTTSFYGWTWTEGGGKKKIQNMVDKFLMG